MAKNTEPALVSTAPTQSAAPDALMQRVIQLLETARSRVVRSVNTATVATYWLIGRELVEAVQQGEQRAAYGQALIKQLAETLTARYGSGFSVANLKNFRQFYLVYADRIGYPEGSQSPEQAVQAGILYPPGREFEPALSKVTIQPLA